MSALNAFAGGEAHRDRCADSVPAWWPREPAQVTATISTTSSNIHAVSTHRRCRAPEQAAAADIVRSALLVTAKLAARWRSRRSPPQTGSPPVVPAAAVLADPRPVTAGQRWLVMQSRLPAVPRQAEHGQPESSGTASRDSDRPPQRATTARPPGGRRAMMADQARPHDGHRRPRPAPQLRAQHAARAPGVFWTRNVSAAA